MSNTTAVLHGAHDLRIEVRDAPVPRPNEVLVQVGAVGICGSDIHYFDAGRIGTHIVEKPMVLGHESAGTILEVGDDVDPGRVGESVALEPGVPCRECSQCLAGRYNLCPRIRFFATPPVDGCLGTLVTIDALFAHPVPADLPLERAAMAEPLSVGIWACRKAAVSAGDRVLVTGAGPVGLLAAQVARTFGATTVCVTDVSAFRLGVAQTLGFATVTGDEAIGDEFDVLLECSGAEAALTKAIESIAPAGRIVLVGMGSDVVRLDLPLIQERELTVSGIFRYANTYPLAISMLAAGQIDVDSIITHRFGLQDAEDALTLARREPRSLKAIIAPS